MKKSLAIVAAAAAVLLSEGTFFRLFHFPGAGYMILFGTLAAVVACVLALVYLLKKPGLAATKWVSVLTIMLTFVAVMFKALHWPGASILVAISLGLLLPIAIILMAVAFARSKE